MSTPKDTMAVPTNPSGSATNINPELDIDAEFNKMLEHVNNSSVAISVAIIVLAKVIQQTFRK